MPRWAAPGRTPATPPFRRFKSNTHEGGVATPLIAHWPAGIRDAGGLRATPAHVIDLLPTLAELAGAAYPAMRDGQRIIPAEGRSLVPIFGDGTLPARDLFFEHQGDRAMIRGD